MYLIGIDPTRVRTSTEGAEYAIGQIAFNETSSAGAKGYIYVQDSGSAITGDGYICLMASDFTAVMATTTTGAPGTGGGKLVGIARAAIAASGYGWLQVFGAGTIRTLTLAAAYTILNTTATAGTADDDATAGSRVIEGITLNAATGGATANTAGFLNWPKVSRTL